MFETGDRAVATDRASAAHRAERKRAEILDAAKDLFLEKGYSGTTMDTVAERAAGSKETIYAHFGNKAGLLKAIIEEAGEALRASLDGAQPERSIRSYLTNLAQNYLDLILQPRSLALYRLIISESGRMPEIGDLFYRTCPENFLRGLAQYFSQAHARDEIDAPDPYHLATAFYGMLRGELQMRALFNPTRAPSRKEKQEQARFVVDSILRLCSVNDDAGSVHIS